MLTHWSKSKNKNNQKATTTATENKQTKSTRILIRAKLLSNLRILYKFGLERYSNSSSSPQVGKYSNFLFSLKFFIHNHSSNVRQVVFSVTGFLKRMVQFQVNVSYIDLLATSLSFQSVYLIYIPESLI